MLPVTSVALLVVSAASDWPGGWLSRFWAEHSLLTNLYSSVLFVLLGISVVERYMREASDRRMALVSAVAADAAARGPLNQWRIMWFLVCGGKYIEDDEFPMSQTEKVQLSECLKRHGLKEVNEAAVRAGNENVPDVEARLALLLQDSDWVFLAHDTLRGFTFHFRRIVARWSPLLASSSASEHVLLDLSAQAREVTDLFIRLRPVARDGDAILTDDIRAEIALRWRTSFCNAVSLDKGLLNFSEQVFAPWSEGVEKLLAPGDRAALDTRCLGQGESMRIFA